MSSQLHTPDQAQAEADIPALEEVQARIADLFGAVCAAPDDKKIAAAADRALLELEAILAARAG